MTASLVVPIDERVDVRIAALEARVDELSKQLPEERATILVLSADMERVHAALMVAHGTAALGFETSVYFAMWGVQALCTNISGRGKSLMGRCLSTVLATDISHLPSQRLNFGGIGPKIFERVMKSKSIHTGAELMELAPEVGIELVCCPTSLDMFEIKAEELLGGITIRGVASFVESAQRSRFSCTF